MVFDKETSDSDIQDSLENTQLLPLLMSLDNGIEIRIGEKGTRLSRGEKQRLALFRLWFEHSDIVALDKATSALDNLTEGIVIKKVLEQVKHVTMTVIAHRLTSIREFDRIVLFREGKIVGSGAFEELLANNQYFYELYKKEKTGTSCFGGNEL